VRKDEGVMGIDTLDDDSAFMKEREPKNHNRKQGEGKVRVNPTKSALEMAQRYYGFIKRVLEYVLVAGIVGGGLFDRG